ncbi:MAG: FecR family protein [Deltaproteobacteria bacterium]|nr:FecR family protein [Deltaproteobacteria bacterium]
MTPKKLWAILALLCFSLTMIAGAQAAVVGHFTQVEGQVDLLKQGKIPATPAKVNDGVEQGDVIRTKSKAKAQVKFVDDSQLTMAPESRMAVADFTYNADKGERRAVLRFFKGVMHTVVTRILKTQEPDFLMETHTAVLGVRGTENYTVLLPNATGAYLIDGLLDLRSNNPKILEVQLLKKLEFSTIPLNLPPMMPRPMGPAMQGMLNNLMNTGLSETAFIGAGADPRGPGGPQIPEVLGFTRQDRLMQPVITPQLVPPVVPPPAPAPAPSGGSGTGS